VRLLALDFDGVICDSARECFAVALRAHAALRPGSPLRGREGDGALYARFVELMPLGNRAEDFGVALDSLAEGVVLAGQAEYDAFYRTRAPEALRAFHGLFYEARAAWSAADPAGWLAQMAPYPGVCAFLRRSAGRVALGLATAKDRRSVRLLLQSYGVADLFPEQRVLDKEAGVRKRDHVAELARRLAVPVAEITFLDDKVTHLTDVAALGARCALAAWGYNGERERAEAARRGFLVCSLDDLEARLFA
jgi:phosphoglycolate phosphatase-like HAD superfamily hydrolase